MATFTIVTEVDEMPEPRRALCGIADGKPTGYIESDRDWVLANIDQCVAFLQAATESE